MEDERRETTLGDHLRMVSRRRWLIFATAVVCAAAGLALSLVQNKTYEARSSLTVRDPSEALSLVGGAGTSGQTPLQLASSHAQQVTRPEVVRRVKSDLRTPLGLHALSNSVDVSVDPNSALVEITAHARTASGAAAVANAFARADASLTTAATRRGWALQAGQVRKQLAKTSKNSPNRAIYAEQLSRLQGLASVATPVSVNTTAGPPLSPTSPKPLRNTLAALVFGLLLGVALAYARDALDQRLRQPSDIEGILHHPIVGQVPSEALGTTPLPSSKNGSSTSDVAQESFRILRQNVRYLSADDPLGTAVVTSAAAEEGKSTVAVSLAFATAAAGRRTLLVECDLRRPVLASRLGLPEGPGLTDFLTGQAEPGEILRPLPVEPISRNGAGPDSGMQSNTQLACITCGTVPPRPAELLASRRFQEFLAEVGQAYDAVVLDTAPLLTVADTLEIVPHVSAVLVCVRLRQTTRDQLHAAQAALERMPLPTVGAVVTDVKPADEGYYGYYRARADVTARA